VSQNTLALRHSYLYSFYTFKDFGKITAMDLLVILALYLIPFSLMLWLVGGKGGDQ